MGRGVGGERRGGGRVWVWVWPPRTHLAGHWALPPQVPAPRRLCHWGDRQVLRSPRAPTPRAPCTQGVCAGAPPRSARRTARRGTAAASSPAPPRPAPRGLCGKRQCLARACCTGWGALLALTPPSAKVAGTVGLTEHGRCLSPLPLAVHAALEGHGDVVDSIQAALQGVEGDVRGLDARRQHVLQHRQACGERRGVAAGARGRGGKGDPPTGRVGGCGWRAFLGSGDPVPSLRSPPSKPQCPGLCHPGPANPASPRPPGAPPLPRPRPAWRGSHAVGDCDRPSGSAPRAAEHTARPITAGRSGPCWLSPAAAVQEAAHTRVPTTRYMPCCTYSRR